MWRVFVVRHVIGVGLFAYLTFSALRLKMDQLALGAAALTLLYLGVALWMGRRLLNAGRPR
jgi:hypothetical protein